MTFNLFALQQDVFDFYQAESPWEVHDTDVPTATTVLQENGRIKTYSVMRFNDASIQAGGRAVGGPRLDDMFTYIDVLGIGNTPAKAREVVWGETGAANILLGYQPAGGGAVSKAAGGMVFEVSDANAKPAFFIARCALRVGVNQAS